MSSALGDEVRERREALGLTQQVAATSVGMALRTWSTVESGRPCNVTTLERIARVLGASLAELLTSAEARSIAQPVAS